MGSFMKNLLYPVAIARVVVRESIKTPLVGVFVLLWLTMFGFAMYGIAVGVTRMLGR